MHKYTGMPQIFKTGFIHLSTGTNSEKLNFMINLPHFLDHGLKSLKSVGTTVIVAGKVFGVFAYCVFFWMEVPH